MGGMERGGERCCLMARRKEICEEVAAKWRGCEVRIALLFHFCRAPKRVENTVWHSFISTHAGALLPEVRFPKANHCTLKTNVYPHPRTCFFHCF